MFLRDFITKGDIFEFLVQLIIMVQTILIIFENPLTDPLLKNVGYRYWINAIQEYITYFFIGEMIIKIIVYGFL